MAPPSSNYTGASALKRKSAHMDGETGSQQGASTQSLTLLAEVAAAGLHQSEGSLLDNALSMPRVSRDTSKAGRPPRGPSRKANSGGSGSQGSKGTSAPSKGAVQQSSAHAVNSTPAPTAHMLPAHSCPLPLQNKGGMFQTQLGDGALTQSANHAMATSVVAAAPAVHNNVSYGSVTDVGLVSMQQRLDAMYDFYKRQQDAYLLQAEACLAALRSKNKPGAQSQQPSGVQAVLRTLDIAVDIMQRAAHTMATSAGLAPPGPCPADKRVAGQLLPNASIATSLQHGATAFAHGPSAFIPAANPSASIPAIATWHSNPSLPPSSHLLSQTKQPQQLQHQGQPQQLQHQVQPVQVDFLQLLQSGAVPLAIPGLSPVAANPVEQQTHVSPLLDQLVPFQQQQQQELEQYIQKQEERRHQLHVQKRQRQHLLQLGLQAAQATELGTAPNNWPAGQQLVGQLSHYAVYDVGIQARA